jgi:3-deoxy-manno-octulosonate cytidylyltransferase (CMP-KDO synthetase)
LKVVGIIPARFQSSRFPGKPLALIGNKPMIEWTYFHASGASNLHDLYVATDNDQIHQTVLGFGGKSILTSSDHISGTDRIIESIEKLSGVDIVVNIQGDEPGISKTLIDSVVQLKLENRSWEMTTAASLLHTEEDKLDPNKVKVVFDKFFKALYFSRSLIPSNFKKQSPVYKHLGIYCYEKEALLGFKSMPTSRLEESESLEQLRALENGYSIGVSIYQSVTEVSAVDVPTDLEKVKEQFRALGLI